MPKKIFAGEETVQSEEGSDVKLQFYLLKENKFYKELGIKAESYGIAIAKVQDKILEYNTVEDITTEEAKAKELLERLKINGVMPVHLKDVIEDWLSCD